MYPHNKVKFSFTKIFIILSMTFLICISTTFPKQKFYLNIDIAQFQDSDKNSYLEIYYAIPEAAVYFKKQTDNNYLCDILTNIHIYHADSLWASKLWKIQQTVADSTQLGSKQIVDILRYQVTDEGQYKIKLQARDLHFPTHEDSVVVTVPVRKFLNKDLDLSDIQMSSMIQRASANTQSKFIKHNYEIIPNPAGIYGEGTPHFFFYYETYNLLQNISGNKYKTLCLVKEYNGNVIQNLVQPHRTKIKKFDSDVEIGKIDLSNLHSGIYNLIYGICDSDQNILLSRQKEFYVYNPSIEIPSPLAEANLTEEGLGFLESYVQAQLDDEFEKMFYLTNKNQRNLYDNLSNETAKRKFIYSIWQTMRRDPAISIVENRTAYLNRIEEANQRFYNSFKPGWKTDKGRVFVQYGPPSNIERHPSIAETKPYEIWEYENLEGGVYFVFIDRIGMNNYELIHSTLRGEMYEPNWERLISTDFQR